MLTKILLFVGLIMLTYQKKESPEHIPIPGCVQKMIEQIQKEKVWNPPASVFRYVYKGKTVYYVPIRCCDIPSKLFDENCNLMCFPSGGFTSRGDGKCTDFYTGRTAEELIWQDNRK